MDDYKPRTENELKQIAMDLHDGKIFCDLHLGEHYNFLNRVFLPIALGAFNDKDQKYIEKIGMFYEYMDKALNNSINEFPCFASFSILDVKDAEKMITYHDDYKKMKDKFKTTEK